MPKRIQRSRRKGWKMPANAIYVGRPTKWGNPYPVEEFGRDEAVGRFRVLFERRAQGLDTEFPLPSLEELRGKDLACWCPLDKKCHADVLIEEANREAV
jgi:hypothetical protein